MPTHRSTASSGSLFSPSSSFSLSPPSSGASPALLLPLNATEHRPWLAPWTKTGTAVLTGYQIWAVEQRVTDRDAVLPAIVVLTGDKNDSITLDRFMLAPPSPESTSANLTRAQTKQWEETIAILKASGARINDTSDGFLPVTSLASLPPTMSIVQIPEGDYEKHKSQLYLQINLRRLGLGGRKSLSLSDATSAQQLHFRQAYHLPIAAPSVHPVTMSPRATPIPPPVHFSECVIELVKLVQHALSLFGLGVVRVLPLTDEVCDTTVDALALFRDDIADNLLRSTSDDSTLAPALLAALLSLVISTRGKLIILGCSGVPKDPFARRQKFLYACETFQRTHRLTPLSPYLTRPLLSAIATLWAKSRHGDSTRATKTIGRAIRTRLDALDALSSSRHGDEVETASLEVLVHQIEVGVGGSSVGRVWGVKSKHKERKEEKGKEREAKEREADMTEAQTDDGGEKSGVEKKYSITQQPCTEPHAVRTFFQRVTIAKTIPRSRDPPAPYQWLSRKRLEMDVNLRMTAWTLRQRERRLAEMADALAVVHASYGQALESLQGPLKKRSAHCDALEATAASLTYHAESYATSTSPIAHLATGSSRLLYAQSVLEDKLSESVLEFTKILKAKVGPGGTLDVGTRALGRERSGVRRFVATLSQWGDWLGVLSTRLQWHLRRWGRTDDKDE
ncbi:hypothetical protein RQP46_002638 [Phenoliferia psychrophenolica]